MTTLRNHRCTLFLHFTFILEFGVQFHHHPDGSFFFSKVESVAKPGCSLGGSPVLLAPPSLFLRSFACSKSVEGGWGGGVQKHDLVTENHFGH
jgi:hypothetical protein